MLAINVLQPAPFLWTWDWLWAKYTTLSTDKGRINVLCYSAECSWSVLMYPHLHSTLLFPVKVLVNFSLIHLQDREL